jgi:hypothetical protein
MDSAKLIPKSLSVWKTYSTSSTSIQESSYKSSSFQPEKEFHSRNRYSTSRRESKVSKPLKIQLEYKPKDQNGTIMTAEAATVTPDTDAEEASTTAAVPLGSPEESVIPMPMPLIPPNDYVYHPPTYLPPSFAPYPPMYPMDYPTYTYDITPSGQLLMMTETGMWIPCEMQAYPMMLMVQPPQETPQLAATTPSFMEPHPTPSPNERFSS